uniref:Probable 4-coumarate--CoA ligase 3 n=1 Tax=Cacopsylla melanoneura TaxID=428564 RepID=A0A8D8QLR5_9HEMI
MDQQLVSSYVFELLRSQGDRILMTESETGKSLSAKDILTRSKQISSHLSRLGFKPDDVIAYVSSNCSEFVCILLGILDTGATVALGNPNFTEYELSKFLSMISPKCVIYSPNNANTIATVAVTMPFIQYMSTSDIISQSSQIQLNGNLISSKPSNGKHHRALILLSSGTTGFPKAAMVSHHGFLMNLKYGMEFQRDQLTMLGILPFYHIYGLLILLDSLCHGTLVVTMAKFNPGKFIENIKKHQISVLPIVPSLCLSLLKSSVEDLSSLKIILTAGAMMIQSIMLDLLDKFPDNALHIYNIYGITEASSIVCCSKVQKGATNNDEKHTDDGQMIGKMPTYVQAKIIHPITSQVLPDGSPGELCLKGATVFLGYLNNPEANKDSIDEEGWLHTGDLCFRNPDGAFILLGRIKELIKYQGNQISPYELESLFRNHPDVEDVAVIGIPHKIFGELPAAMVVPKVNVRVVVEDLQRFVEAQINPTKWLRGGVYLYDQEFIPRTASGKVKRKELLRKHVKIHELQNN